MRLIIEPDYERMSKWAANYVAKCINEARALRHGVEESVNHMWTIRAQGEMSVDSPPPFNLTKIS